MRIGRPAAVSILFLACLGSECTTNGIPGAGSLVRTFPRTLTWPSVTISQGAAAFPAVVAPADLNFDGLVDLVVGFAGDADNQAQIAVFFQVTPLQWSGLTILSGPAVQGVAALAVADVNQDGTLDIVAACNGQIVYLQSPRDPLNALGWLGDVIAQSSGAGIGQWTDLAVRHVDRLFGPDIIACNADPGRLSWFRAPQFAVSGAGWQRLDIDSATRAAAQGIAVADIDRDGNPDVVSTARGDERASIAWYRHPGGNVEPALLWGRFEVGNLPNATRVDLGDLNRDGRIDVVASSPSDLMIAWYAQPADVYAAAAWPGVVLAEFAQNRPTDLRVADIDANGQLDLVVATADAGTLRWFTPVNDVRARWVENNLVDLDLNVARFGLADVDRDGRPDVVAPLLAAQPGGDALAWFQNPEL